ncbi:Uncharacterized protein BM_BM487 [Brugia malayi]|uniref:Uncharacterized protein n=1 Tax=Brugia malayi TaxID=6279 RepID=A0A4E9FPG2_BRUMA|nr:Uncharacterized protein BM_BM487 [Brugia malayi]VIO98330.1 Uncharacterized protein BM_BM487 [Brugia malayi]
MSSTGRIFFISVLIAILQFQLAQTKAIGRNKAFKKFDWNLTIPVEAMVLTLNADKVQKFIHDEYKKQLEAESQKINQPNRRRRKRQLQHAVLPKQAYIVKSLNFEST